ncbi:hypothetical protein RKD31_000883 [Streptomyces sp. SAI-163]
MAADRTPDAKSLFEAWLQLWNGTGFVHEFGFWLNFRAAATVCDG